MTKICFLRRRVQEHYNKRQLADAAEMGEALMHEHWHNDVTEGVAYADDLFNLACVYDELGHWEHAIALYYESAQEIVRYDGVSVAFSYRLNNLAALLNRHGNAEHAYHLYAHVRDIMRAELERNDLRLADSLYNLANAAADTGRQAEAMRLHAEALRIRERDEDTEDEDVMHSLHSIAFLLEDNDNKKAALAYAKNAIKKAGPDDYHAACYYAAELSDHCEEYEQAGKLYGDVLPWLEEQGGPKHSAYINVALRLAHSLARSDHHTEALALFTEIHERFRAIDGEKHFFYANCLRSMALLQRHLNQPSEAERLMLQSIQIRAAGGEDIREDAITLLEWYLQANRFDRALDWLVYVLMRNAGSKSMEEALEAVTQSFAHVDPSQLDSLLDALESLNDRGRLQPMLDQWAAWEKA